MDTLTYSPNIAGARRSMTFNILQSMGWEREIMMDPSNTTYECTRVRGSVLLSYNPGLNKDFGPASFVSVPNQPGTVPNSLPGQMPALTDAAIRRFLEQPRGQLVVTSAGSRWLVSPPDGRNGIQPCDVRNGPFTKVNSVQYIRGERLWQIHLEFETYINESPNAPSLPPLVLSNRWYAIDDTNWQHLRTRKYQGICTVRGDVLQQQAVGSTFIDSLRNSFAAFSIPQGFQRTDVHVTVTPDGNSAHYVVVDTEQIFNKSANCPAVRIDVADSSWLWTGTAMRALGQAGGVAGIAARAAAFGAYTADAIASLNMNPSATAAIGLALQTIEMVGQSVIGNLPKAYKNVLVRAWGNQRTPRGILVDYAMQVASARLTGVGDLLNTSSKEILVSQDSDNFVQVSSTVNWGLDVPAAAFGNVGAIGFGLSAFLDAQINPRTNLAVNLYNRTIFTSTTTTSNTGIVHAQDSALLPNLTNPVFPASSGTRGTAATNPSNPTLQQLVTQTLEAFDAVPAAVP